MKKIEAFIRHQAFEPIRSDLSISEGSERRSRREWGPINSHARAEHSHDRGGPRRRGSSRRGRTCRRGGGESVAIVLPPRGLAARAPGGGELNGLAEYAKARVTDTRAAASDPIAMERLIEAGGQTCRCRSATRSGVGGRWSARPRRSRGGTAGGGPCGARRGRGRRCPRGGRAQAARRTDRGASGHEVEMAVATSKAVRLGCDLARGAIALVAEISSASPSRHRAGRSRI